MQIQNAILTGSTTVYGPITFVSGTLAGSASYAATSSYADTFTVAGSLTAQTLVVQTITSSVSFITGSTRFGSLLTNTHTFTGSLQVTGSGPHTIFGNVQVGNITSTSTATPVILSLGGTFNSAAAGSNVKLRVYEDATAIGGMGVSSGQMEVNTWSSGKIAFYRGTTQTAVIDASGNLGIGTATPISRLQVETSSISSGNIFALRNSAVWSTPMMTSIAIKDSNNDVGAIGWRYNGSGGTVDMHIHSLYNNAYTNTSNIVMTVRGNGNVGIGTVLPNALLHVSGSGSGSLFQISSTVSSSIFFVSGSGNVGIGTISPSTTLDVSGSTRITNGLSLTGSVNITGSITQTGVNTTSSFTGNVGIGITTPSAVLHTAGVTKLGGGNLHVSSDQTFVTSNSYTFRDAMGINNPNSVSYPVSSNYTVAIGSSGGGGSLLTAGPIYSSGSITVSVVNYPQLVLNSSNNNGPQLRFQGGGSDTSGIGHITSVSNLQFSSTSSLAVQMTLSQAGNVSIGSNLQFDSNGDFYQKTTGGAAIWSATANTTYPSYGFYGNTGIGMYRASADVLAFTTSASERMRITSAGYVGIGTTSPDNGVLTILKNTSYNTENSYAISIQSSATNAYTELQIGAADAVDCGVIQTAGKNTSFTTKKLALQPNGGYVGIGTTAAASKLHLYDGTNPLSLKIQRTTVPVYFSDVQTAGTTAGAAWSHNMENTSNGSVSWGGFTNTAYAGSAIMLNADTSTSWITLHTAASVNTNPTERMRITGGGSLLVGSTSGPTVSGGNLIKLGDTLFFEGTFSVSSPYTQVLRIDIVWNNWGGNNVAAIVDVDIVAREWANSGGVAFGRAYALSSAGATTFNNTLNTTDITTANGTFALTSPANYTLRLTFTPTNNKDVMGFLIKIPASTSGTGAAVTSIAASIV